MAIGATAVWRIRPSGSNTNGGGYDGTSYPGGTDYSQQNAAQASGSAGTATGTAVFTDTVAAAFTAAMVGNAIWIASGAGFTVGAYFVISRQSTTQVTLDRSPGTGTVAVWKLGGGWADFWTNTTSSGQLVPGNTVYILGSGTPNPAAYVYDYTYSAAADINLAAGSNTAGVITIANDPATPGYKAPPDTTGGMPVFKWNSTNQILTSNALIQGIYSVSAVAANCVFNLNGLPGLLFGCVHDQFSFDVTYANVYCSGGGAFASEVFSSVAPGSNGSTFGLACNFGGNTGAISGCNVHDAVGNGISIGSSAVFTISNTIVAKCRGDGVQIGSPAILQNLTIDGNLGHGIHLTTQAALSLTSAVNCIISNHVTAGKFGVTVDAGTAAANNLVKLLIDYNSFYNNTTNYNAISAGSHDTALGSNPFVGQSTENYTLA